MDKMSDQRYLLEEQYKDATNLNARIRVHEQFSTNPYNLQMWLFDHYTLPEQARILEIGCGPGTLWLKNLHRIPPGWHITLSDFSHGMLDESRRNLSKETRLFTFAAADAQRLPFEKGSFDAVIANFMLYHVPDRAGALAEIGRVLRPKGHLYAATLGRGHLRELRELVHRIDPEAAPLRSNLVEAFGLENGMAQLASQFGNITLHRYDDRLLVTEIEPLVKYVQSAAYGSALVGEKLSQFEERVAEEIAQHGAIHISKDSGLFVASR